MICHAKPVLESALGALKNLREDCFAENIGGINFLKEKRAVDQKKMNVSINIKFQNAFNKTVTYSTALNFRVEWSFSHFAFLRFLHSNIT